MKKTALLIILLGIIVSISNGQTANDSIIMVKVFGGYQFKQGDKVLNMNKLTKAMTQNPQAYAAFKDAKSSYSLAMATAAAGGFLVGYPLGQSFAGGDPQWVLLGAGCGLIALSIPLSNKFNKRAKEAVDIYNSGLSTSSFWDNSELRLSVSENGLGLTLHF